ATKARIEYIQKEKRREEWEIENMAETERQEIRDIYAKKGFTSDLLDEIVKVITSRKKIWIDTMMKEELGLIEDGRRPFDTALSTILGFAVIGMIPLIPFVFLYVSGLSVSVSASFAYSIAFTLGAFFLIGMIKGRMVKKSLFRSGSATLLVGVLAAAVAYVVGYALSSLVNGA
ncbi:MAG: VIT1/CCC1 transporter family protein, partial [Candidatus Nitrosotenuis sp.]|nr:VIT1/CCC1 transporter family protein [Candidatus Nitrosotenuis sp.]